MCVCVLVNTNDSLFHVRAHRLVCARGFGVSCFVYVIAYIYIYINIYIYIYIYISCEVNTHDSLFHVRADSDRLVCLVQFQWWNLERYEWISPLSNRKINPAKRQSHSARNVQENISIYIEITLYILNILYGPCMIVPHKWTKIWWLISGGICIWWLATAN